MFDTSNKLFYTLRNHYSENGLIPRTHGNKNRLPSNANSLETTEHVKLFIENNAKSMLSFCQEELTR